MRSTEPIGATALGRAGTLASSERGHRHSCAHLLERNQRTNSTQGTHTRLPFACACACAVACVAPPPPLRPSVRPSAQPSSIRFTHSTLSQQQKETQKIKRKHKSRAPTHTHWTAFRLAPLDFLAFGHRLSLALQCLQLNEDLAEKGGGGVKVKGAQCSSSSIVGIEYSFLRVCTQGITIESKHKTTMDPPANSLSAGGIEKRCSSGQKPGTADSYLSESEAKKKKKKPRATMVKGDPTPSLHSHPSISGNGEPKEQERGHLHDKNNRTKCKEKKNNKKRKNKHLPLCNWVLVMANRAGPYQSIPQSEHAEQTALPFVRSQLGRLIYLDPPFSSFSSCFLLLSSLYLARSLFLAIYLNFPSAQQYVRACVRPSLLHSCLLSFGRWGNKNDCPTNPT